MQEQTEEQKVEKIQVAQDKAVTSAVATTTSHKAIVAGAIAGIVTPLNNVLQWIFITYLHMPDNIAYSAGMVVCGLVGYFATYNIPNRPKDDGQSS